MLYIFSSCDLSNFSLSLSVYAQTTFLSCTLLSSGSPVSTLSVSRFQFYDLAACYCKFTNCIFLLSSSNATKWHFTALKPMVGNDLPRRGIPRRMGDACWRRRCLLAIHYLWRKKLWSATSFAAGVPLIIIVYSYAAQYSLQNDTLQQFRYRVSKLIIGYAQTNKHTHTHMHTKIPVAF